jgi:hypothetical protein
MMQRLLLVLSLCVAIQWSHLSFGIYLSRHAVRTGSTESLEIPAFQVSPKLLSLGFDALIADVYWLALVQYVGETNIKENDKVAEIYIREITDLDPYFVEPFYFAAFIIGSEMKNPVLAAQIIEKGIAANPDNWTLPFIAGVNQYLYAHNENTAARYYRMAAKLPNAPDWLDRQAEILQSNIPSQLKSISVWERVYQYTSERDVKERAKLRLVSLWLTVYKSAPTATIKNKAMEQLHLLGVDGYK